MNDKTENRGGKRDGAGRKSKDQEQTLIEKLSPFEALAFTALENALNESKDWAVKLYFQYKYGMPKQVVDNNVNLKSDIENPFERIRENHGLNTKTDTGD